MFKNILLCALMVLMSAFLVKAQTVLRSNNEDFREGEQLVQNGRWSEALSFYDTIIPGKYFYGAFYNRGIARLKLHDTAGYCIDMHNAAFMRDSIEMAFASPYCVRTETWYYNKRKELQDDSTSYHTKEIIKTYNVTREQLYFRYDSTGRCIEKYFVFNTNDTVVLNSSNSTRASFRDNKFFGKNLRYPAYARENDMQGTVLVGLHVSEKGEVIGAEGLLGEKSLVDEAVRVVQMIKQFPAATRNGKATDSYVIMPITFQLSTK